MDQVPGDHASALNKAPGGWSEVRGLSYVSAAADEVIAELEVSE